MASHGKALTWTDKKLEALSEISESDKEAAAVFWKKHAPEEAKDILDAGTLDIPVE